MVLMYWGGIGLVVGGLTHLLLRTRGEQGYNLVGEMMLGALGALSLAMTLGVLFGWGQIFTRSGTTQELIASGVAALIGGLIVDGVVVYFTLRASPLREPSRRAS
jgi:hypothetical protein